MSKENEFRENEGPQDQRLDRGLEQWARTESASAEHLNQLLDAIEKSMERSPPPSALAGFSDQERSSKFGVAMFATVALLLLIVSVVWFNGTGDGGDSHIASLAMTQVDVVNQKEVLKRFDEVYGGDLVWVSDVDGKLQVELGNRQPQNEFVGIRWVLVSRPTTLGEVDWKVEKTIDLLAGGEELIQLPMSDGKSLELSVWAFPIDKDYVSIDLECSFHTPVEMRVSSTELQKNGEAMKVFSLTSGGTEYRLYQTVDRLGTLESFGEASAVDLRGVG